MCTLNDAVSDCSSLAAWVQAISSVVLIACTIGIVLWQRAIEKQAAIAAHKESIKRYVDSAYALAIGAEEKGKLLFRWSSSGGTNGSDLIFMRAELTCISYALKQLPIWQLESFDLLVTINALQALSDVLLETVAEAEKRHALSSTWAQYVKGQLMTLLPELKLKIKQLAEARSKLN